jgi:2-methylisoborneol synthase
MKDLLTGPSGLGTSAARLGRPEAVALPPEPGYAERPWGDGTAPPLYVPVLEREDALLAAAVDERLVAWAEECGFEEPERFLGGMFGRLAVLTHVDTDDVDQLLIAARLNAAWWAADDLYADDTEMGAIPA